MQADEDGLLKLDSNMLTTFTAMLMSLYLGFEIVPLKET